MRVQEEAAEQEEQGGEGDDGGVSQDVIRHDGTDEDDEGVGGEEGDVEDDEEVEEGASKGQSPPGDEGVDHCLESKKREVSDEAGGCVRGGAVGVEGGLADEDEAFLDEGGDGVV